jgi:hypothetical protein
LLGLALLPVNLLGQDVFRPAEILFIDGKHAIQGAGSEDYFCESYGLRQGCFPYFGVPLPGGAVYQRLSLAPARSGAFSQITAVFHRTGKWDPAV